MPKSTYRHNTEIGKYCTILISAKKIWFWPSTHVNNEASFVKIASNSWQAEVIAHSTSYQTLWTDKNSARNHSTTKLVFKWTVTTIHSTWAVKLAGKIILKSSFNSPNSRQTYHCCCCWCYRCILHHCHHCLNLSPVQAQSLVALPLLCNVVSLLCLLILTIPLYSSTNNTSLIDFYYPDNVNTTNALIVSIQMVLVGFVLHTVEDVYVAMLLAWTLLKLEDGA